MISIKRNHDLASMTTFRLPARAAAVAEYSSSDELRQLLNDIRLPRPFKSIGQGSNLLFTSDFPGTILHNTDRSIVYGHEKNLTTVTAASGVVMDDLCAQTAAAGFWGLENLSGIPGEAGASAVQNVGAYGVEAGDIITCVHAFDTKLHRETILRNDELGFSYRDSIFKQPNNRDRYVILSVTFRISQSAGPNIGYSNLEQTVMQQVSGGEITPMAVRQAVIKIRDEKLPSPSQIGSAGSFFKNPVVSTDIFRKIQSDNAGSNVPHFTMPDGTVKIPAAWLIDRTGWKGAIRGNAGVWQKQPLVIVNLTGNATADEIISLENEITESVYSRFGIRLTPEVEHVGTATGLI